MSQPVALIRRILPVLGVGVLAAVLYDAWIFYARWSNAREGQKAQREEEIRRDRETLDQLGGSNFRIINFYAVPQVVRRGAKTKICFGVFGAKRVRIEPAIEDLKPAISYCLEAAPQRTTDYKLIAEDGAGHTVTASLSVNVLP